MPTISGRRTGNSVIFNVVTQIDVTKNNKKAWHDNPITQSGRVQLKCVFLKKEMKI